MGFGVEGVMAKRALLGRRDELAHRCVGGEYEAEAVVELKLDVPFREAFRAPFDHVLSLTEFSVLMFEEDAGEVVGRARGARGRGTVLVDVCHRGYVEWGVEARWADAGGERRG
jgi:hypothetical protein